MAFQGSFLVSCYGAQQDCAIPDTQLYSQSHGGSLVGFGCFPGCSSPGQPNDLCISCAAVVGSLIPNALSWPPQCSNHSQAGSVKQQGSPVQGHSLFPWRTTWPHLGFL